MNETKTPLEQALYDSGYAFTERERHIAEDMWKRAELHLAPKAASITAEDLKTVIAVETGGYSAQADALLKRITSRLNVILTSRHSSQPVKETGLPEAGAETAESLAKMVIEWVEGGVRLGTDWRNGLANVIKLRLERSLSAKDAEIAELREWKRQQMIVSAELDSQKIAKMLGACLGQSCNKVINYRVPEVLAELEAAKIDAAAKDAEIARIKEVLRCSEVNNALQIKRAMKAEVECADLRTTLRCAQAKSEAAHAVLDSPECKIVRNAKDGYPEGRAERVLTLEERVRALLQMKMDYKRWMEEREQELDWKDRHLTASDTIQRLSQECDALKAQLAARQSAWVACSERMPQKEDADVIWFWMDCGMRLFKSWDCEFRDKLTKPTHWMPLPPLPTPQAPEQKDNTTPAWRAYIKYKESNPKADWKTFCEAFSAGAEGRERV